MHSNWQIWDFFQSYPKGAWSSFSERIVLQSFDPLSLRLMKDHILFGLDTEKRPKQISGADVTVSWIEDQFLSLGLFGNTESWLINSPDEMNAHAKEMFLREDLMLSGRTLAFAFHQDSAYLKKLLKFEGMSHLHLEQPRFWETNKLVDFLCGFFKLPLNFEAKQYILQAIEHDFMPMFDAFRLIKLNYPEKRDVTAVDVTELIGVDRMDQFALATDMGKKAWRSFFERLLSIETDFDRLRGIFSFLQGHALRLADPSYLQGKARLSKYDSEIQTLGRGWQSGEMQRLLLQLQRWEISSKIKDPFLVTELRLALLKAHKNAWPDVC